MNCNPKHDCTMKEDLLLRIESLVLQCDLCECRAADTPATAAVISQGLRSSLGSRRGVLGLW